MSLNDFHKVSVLRTCNDLKSSAAFFAYASDQDELIACLPLQQGESVSELPSVQLTPQGHKIF